MLLGLVSLGGTGRDDISMQFASRGILNTMAMERIDSLAQFDLIVFWHISYLWQMIANSIIIIELWLFG